MEISATKEIKNVFDKLQDEESKAIFMHKLQYLLDEDIEHLYDIIHLSALRNSCKSQKHCIKGNTINEFLNMAIKPKPILYGAALMGYFVMRTLSEKGINIECFCDTNQSKQHQLFYGFEVISPNKLMKEYIYNPIIITSLGYSEEIYSTLKKMGVSDNRIYFMPMAEERYFEPKFIHPKTDEVYIDVGIYDGQTILDFINFSGGKYKKIYGMEPDLENYNKAKQVLNGLRDIELIKKGAWHKVDTLSFNGQHGGSSHLDSEGEDRIAVTTIDEMLDGNAATFIKMDIEGAELNALKGARRTIEKYHPRLAISIYHKPEDILVIPIYIVNLVPEYKLYIRHYQLYYHSDTVLYATL